MVGISSGVGSGVGSGIGVNSGVGLGVGVGSGVGEGVGLGDGIGIIGGLAEGLANGLITGLVSMVELTAGGVPICPSSDDEAGKSRMLDSVAPTSDVGDGIGRVGVGVVEVIIGEKNVFAFLTANPSQLNRMSSGADLFNFL